MLCLTKEKSAANTRSYLKNTPGLYWVRDPSFVGMTVYYCLNWRCLEMLNHLQFLCSANLIPLLLSSRRRRDLFLLNNIFEMASSYLPTKVFFETDTLLTIIGSTSVI